MMAHLSVNFIDVEEYPGMAEVESRCVKIIANLFNAPKEAMGVSTIGSYVIEKLLQLISLLRGDHSVRARRETSLAGQTKGSRQAVRQA